MSKSRMRFLIPLLLFLGCGQEKTVYVDREVNCKKVLPNPESEKKHIFIIGDSTVHNQSTPYLLEYRHMDCGADNPKNILAGWGDFLDTFMKYPKHLDNRARQGSNTLSFRDGSTYPSSYGKGRTWQTIYTAMQQYENNAFLLIQFGSPNEDLHTPRYDNSGERIDYNHDGLHDTDDEPARLILRKKRFRTGINYYIDEAIKLRITPVLITVVEGRRKLTSGEHLNSRGPYPMYMREIAQERGVMLLDLHSKSLSEFSLFTDLELRKDFGDCTLDGNYIDRVHLEPQGAKRVSAYIATLACEAEDLGLCSLFD